MENGEQSGRNRDRTGHIVRDNVAGGIRVPCVPCGGEGDFKIPMEGLAKAYQVVRCEACRGRGYIRPE